MRLRDPKVWLALVSLGLVLWLFALDWERTSPGPLSAAHAQVSGLDTAAGCEQCHAAFGAELARGCLACHDRIDEQLAQGSGLHGAGIDASLARDCALCHGEHHGRELELVGDAAFAQAGWSERAAFDHAHVEFGLVGLHTRLECAACHNQADAQLLAEGRTRFLGLSQECSTCHADPHEGRFARGCAECHGQERPFGELASFEHGRAFPLTGAHGRAACADCHAPGSPYEVEALAGRAPPPPARSCQDCHDSPHRASFTQAVAAQLQLAPGQTCQSCHDAERDSFAGEAAHMSPGLHAASGFELVAPHAAQDCSACHTGSYAEQVAAPMRSAFDCAACHTDPHGDEFAAGPFAAANCLDCHERERFAPTHFGLDEHARTRFALDQSHAAVACSACHADPAPGQPRRFRDTPSDCAACHPDGHTGSLGGEIAAARDCSACHVPTRFADVDPAGFDHQRWTGFALEAAHARANCTACHAPDALSGRRLGPVLASLAGPLDRCAGCHADAHRGAFPDTDCAQCHTTEAFADEGLRVRFDHARWAGLALEGAHGRADCASCHSETLRKEVGDGLHVPSARSLGWVPEHQLGDPRSCATCHGDPHEDLFSEAAALDPRSLQASCAACHSQEAFDDLAGGPFDHGRWTGFALIGSHAQTPCADCHPASAEQLAGMPGLGAAAGRSCAACHEDPHAGQFVRAGRNDCAACHRDDASFADLRFDHARDARFALDERHAGLACSACHVPAALADGRTVVRYRPLGTQCIDCHDHGGRKLEDGR